jgi:hypothetical protein
MDFDNSQSVASVSDTLPYEAISITGRDYFWEKAVRIIINTNIYSIKQQFKQC